MITRNTIGSAVADLRSGPYGSFGVTGPAGQPPFGTGSLGLQVSDNATSGATPAEKVSFGNEVDFFGNQVQNLTAVGFRVFQTSENAAISPSNMPNITLEIDPNVGTSNYTSMVWVPDPIPTVQPTGGVASIAPTTKATGTSPAPPARPPGCDQTTMCTFANAKQALVTNNRVAARQGASIYTVAIAKGRDNAWVGAVDGLRINDTRSTTSSPTGSTRSPPRPRPSKTSATADEPTSCAHGRPSISSRRRFVGANLRSPRPGALRESLMFDRCPIGYLVGGNGGPQG